MTTAQTQAAVKLRKHTANAPALRALCGYVFGEAWIAPALEDLRITDTGDVEGRTTSGFEQVTVPFGHITEIEATFARLMKHARLTEQEQTETRALYRAALRVN
jgi:hypothetical protein